MSDDVVIVGAARTAVGAFNGAFGSMPAHELGRAAIQESLKRAGVEGGRVSEVIMGQILTAAQGQNPARQASIGAGIPVESPAWGVNQLCGSGLRAVALGYQAIMNGDSEIVVAGGQESMSMAPHAAYLRAGQKMGSLEMVDTMIKDGLWDAFNGYHMGTTAENVAKQYQITRGQQDEFAVASQNKAEAAQKAGKFKDEIVPIVIKSRKGDIVVDKDEYPKAGTTLESVSKLRPAFDKEGTVTAANASGINDGAAAVVLMSAAQAAKEGKTVLARIVSWAHAGVDPKIMGTGPIPASRAALKKAGWSIGDLDLIEANEAFAAQACAVNKDLGCSRCKSATPRRASPPSASAAAWASRCVWSADAIIRRLICVMAGRPFARPCTSLSYGKLRWCGQGPDTQYGEESEWPELRWSQAERAGSARRYRRR
jgi:acetyl-CoA C-acetyltransferase